jgi:putative PIG3 family NAD(P)H quinone oxidoreductase
MDLTQREGNYPLPPQAPATLGVEFSGTIESFGPGEHGNFQVGDEVFGLAYGGAYAEYIAVSSKMLLHRPSHLTVEQAAGVPETWITATQALHLIGQLEPGQSVLWHAGASGVSIAGIQLSKKAGAAAVFATAGSKGKCDFIVGELGATAAFNYKDQDWAQEILNLTNGRGVDVVIDYVGANYLQDNLKVLARDGTLVCIGLLSGGQVKDFDMSPILRKRLRIEGSTLRSRDEIYQGKLRDKLQEYLPAFDNGELKIFIDTVLPWEQIQQAHQQMEESKTLGKIICLVTQ